MKAIGFTVTDETISRADFQTMFFRPVQDFIEPIFMNRSVMRARDDKFFRSGGKITGFTCGSKVVLRIYDKRVELLKKPDEVKLSLEINECLGGELPDDLTRVEFQLRREALAYMGVKTVQDLLERETAIVDFLTYDWFRILKDEKKKNHTSEQKMSPLWEEVRAAFMEYFPGSLKERKPIDRKLKGRRSVICSADSLVKQAVGCLATACSLVKGVVENEVQALSFVMDKVGEKAKNLFARIIERTVELGIVRGVESPDALDWYNDPRYAMEGSQVLPPDFRVVWDEDMQYETFRQVAVAGCPF